MTMIDSLTSFHVGDDDASGADSGVGLPPPMVCIPSASSGGPSLRESSLAKRVTSPYEMVSTPTTSVAEKRSGEEKVGRWTEEEHEVFLQGLHLHGKQWKMIATMIGTRTVVQVRTHAQKYFQKMERKNRETGANASSHQSKSKAAKRRSLPSAMPSRKKPKSPKKSIPRSSSLSLPTLSAPPVLPNPLSASSDSISSGNLSTDSPVGVMDLEPNAVTVGPDSSFIKDDQFFMDVTHGFAEDPLEWLLDGDIQNHLPESSIEQAPLFPDFSDVNGDNNGALTLQAQTSTFDASVLDTIADPKVTVQSLFLDDVAY